MYNNISAKVSSFIDDINGLKLQSPIIDTNRFRDSYLVEIPVIRGIIVQITGLKTVLSSKKSAHE